VSAELEDVHILDRDYFHFVRKLVSSNSEVCRRKLRRTEPSPTKSAASAAAASSGGGSVGSTACEHIRRNDDTDHIAFITMNLALKFVFLVRLPLHCLDEVIAIVWQHSDGRHWPESARDPVCS
jgi:hypothetical protein